VRARRLFAITFATIVCCAAPLAVRAADPDVETSVHASQVAPGDPITLRIRLRGAAASSEPDLAPLARDFEVLDVHQSHQTSIINGVRDESVDYTVALVARREGDLVIPALPVGDTATDPMPVTVSARAGDVAERDAEPEAPTAPVLLEAHVDRNDPYEQERVVLRINLYAAGDILEGALSSPEIPGAVVESIGEDRQIEKEIGGKHYGGIERTYTIVPEASGDLAVPQIRFEGRVRMPKPAPQQRRQGGFGHSLLDDFFANSPMPRDLLEGFFGGASQRVAIGSNPLTLRVRPRPEAVAGQWWLPARDVALSEHWDPAAASVRVGEPITRRIELRADGVSPAQLPALPSGGAAGIKQYAEAPKTTETVIGTVRVDETTLIPTQPGSVTLPAIEVAWWDTKADALRKATLPARSIEVLAAAGGGDTNVAASAAPAPATSAPWVSPPPPSAIEPRPGARMLAAFAALAAIALFLLGFFVARRSQRRGKLAAPSGAPPPETRRSAARALRRACARSDVAGADDAVRVLRRALGSDAALLADPALASEIARLQAVRYRAQHEAWSGATLWKAWRRARKLRRPANPAAALPPLYPAP
jgi:hypothetical protein